MSKIDRQVHPALTGKLLAMARELVGFSQAEVARMIGCSQSNIAQIERSDYASPRIETLKRLSELYGLRFDDVVASVVFEKYGVDFSATPTPQNLRRVIAERRKARIDLELDVL